MRVLLDECVPRRLRKELPGVEVHTVVEMGWTGIKNGILLQKAAGEFDAFLTVDQNLQYQQNLSALPIPVIILVTHSNNIYVLQSLMPRVREILSKVQAGRVYKIPSYPLA